MKGRFTLTLVAAMAAPAWGCGVCVEDKVAATYDHAVVTRAAAHHRVVVFAAVEGRGAAKDLAGEAKQAASAVAGVDRHSVRSAHEPAPALSFALDPRAQTPRAALTAIEERTRDRHVKLTLLRVVE